MTSSTDRSPSVLSHVHPPKSSQLIAAQLRRIIIRGELSEGHALPPESELIQTFGVSRPIMREAMRILEAEGLITIQRGVKGGPRVRVPSVDVAARYAGFVLQHNGTTYHDITHARAIMEAHCVRLLAENRSSNQLRRLRGALRDSITDDHREAAHFYAEFHTLIVELAGNDTLALFTRMANAIFENGARNHLTTVADADPGQNRRLQRGANRTHAKLVDLIESRDGLQASELWRKHIYDAEDLQAHSVDLEQAFEALT